MRSQPDALGGMYVSFASPSIVLKEEKMTDKNEVVEQHPSPSGIGDMVITSRSLDEYRAMFALSDADLMGSILDCPGGASSATAEINALGGRAIAVDPLYGRSLTAAELGAHALAEAQRGNDYIRRNPDQYRWTFFDDPEHHLRSRSRSVEQFSGDLAAHPSRYVAAALPELPFARASFDIVLSSHLLFTYADRLPSGFHYLAILELIRVTRNEVRIFPLTPMESRRYPMDRLLAGLKLAGVDAKAVPVKYELQRGAAEMLVCRRS